VLAEFFWFARLAESDVPFDAWLFCTTVELIIVAFVFVVALGFTVELFAMVEGEYSAGLYLGRPARFAMRHRCRSSELARPITWHHTRAHWATSYVPLFVVGPLAPTHWLSGTTEYLNAGHAVLIALR
jgi:hypothetical protein